MARRTYTGVSDTENKSLVSPGGKRVAKPSIGKRIVHGVFLIASIALIAVAAWILLSGGLSGSEYGFPSPQEAATQFVVSLGADHADSASARYFVPCGREAGYAVDSMGITAARRAATRNSMKFSDVEAPYGTHLEGDDLTRLNAGLKRAYEKPDEILDAYEMQVKAQATWTEDGETRTELAEFTVITVKVGKLWYVYTGEPIGSSRINYGEMMDVILDSGLIPAERAEATLALQNGSFTLDGVDMRVPSAYNNFTQFFLIDEDRKDTPLVPGQCCVDVPVVMQNELWKSENFRVSIMNTRAGDEWSSVSDGDVITLFIGGKETPELVLPGNIKLNESSYTEVVEAYTGLARYAGSREGLTVVDENAEILCINMEDGSGSNRVYLQFVDDILAGVQWYVADPALLR